MGCVGPWLRGLRESNFYVGVWVKWVKIFFTLVIILAWVTWVEYIFAWVFAWVKIFCVGPEFLRGPFFFA